MAKYTMPHAPMGEKCFEPCTECGYDEKDYHRVKTNRMSDGEEAPLCLPCAFAYVDEKSKEHLVKEVEMTATEDVKEFLKTGSWSADGMYCAVNAYYEDTEEVPVKKRIAVDAWKKTGDYETRVRGKATLEIIEPKTPGLREDWGDVDLTTEAFKDKFNDN